MTSFTYTNSRPQVKLKEYGRNIQNMVEHIKTMEDKAERSRFCNTLVDFMKQVNPNLGNSNEYNQKIWDDLYIVAGFDLDINSPYPMPEKESIGKKPACVPYKTSEVKRKHYGRNIEILISEISKYETQEEKDFGIIYLGKLMRSFLAAYNRENVDEAVILNDIKKMSKGELDMDLDKIKSENLFDISAYAHIHKEREQRPRHSNQNNRGGHRHNKNRKRR